jgi:hypothetical protein
MKATIKIKNGYWTYNGTPIKDCSFPIQELVASFIKKQIFTIEVKPTSLTKPAEWVLDKKMFTIPNFSRV